MTATAESLNRQDRSGLFERIPLEAIAESPLNPRKHVDEAKLAELVDSIRQHGVIEPIVVRRREWDFDPDFDASEVRYEVVAGARRTRAARAAGLTDVPAMVRVVTDAQLLELALQENIHQATMSAVDEAEALAKLADLDPIYRDPRVLASKIGRSESYVSRRLKLLRLEPVVRAALDADAITVSHAERITRLPLDQQEAALAFCFNPLLLDRDVVETLRFEFDDIADEHRHSEAFLVAIGRWDLLAPTAKSAGALDEWIAEHGRADLTAPEVQQALAPVVPETMVEAHAAAGDDARDAVVDQLASSALQLSRAWMTRSQAQQRGVVRADDWKAIGKRRCAHARPGVVVHGGPLEVLDVCVERKKCGTHWPKPKKATATPAAAEDSEHSYQAQERRREEARKAWETRQPAARAALVAHLRSATLDALTVVQRAVQTYEQRNIERDFGVRLAKDTALVVLALTAVNDYNAEVFAESAKTWGFDVKAWTKQYEAEAAKTGKAALDAQREQLAGEKPKGAKAAAKKGGRS